MERHRLHSYLSMRLSLLEAWEKLYTEFEPGDPELSDEAEVYLEQIQALDQREMLEWDRKGKNDIRDIAEKHSASKRVLEKIYKLHQNHHLNLINHKKMLVLEMKGVRKAKALSGQILTASEDRISILDTEA